MAWGPFRLSGLSPLAPVPPVWPVGLPLALPFSWPPGLEGSVPASPRRSSLHCWLPAPDTGGEVAGAWSPQPAAERPPSG